VEKPSRGRAPTPHERAQVAHICLHEAAKRFDRIMEEYCKNSWVWCILCWRMVSLWVSAMTVFGSDMRMAFIGRVNQGGNIAVARTICSVRKDCRAIERLFRTRFGNRPRHRKMMYKIALFTGILWVTGRNDPMSYTARALVMAWITRDVRATALAMVSGTVAVTPFDWALYDQLIPAVSEAASGLSWTILSWLTVASATGALAVLKWLRTGATSGQLTSAQLYMMMTKQGECSNQLEKSLVLQKQMRAHIEKLEASLGEAPTPEQITKW